MKFLNQLKPITFSCFWGAHCSLKLDFTLEINQIEMFANEILVTSARRSHELEFDRSPLAICHPPAHPHTHTPIYAYR